MRWRVPMMILVLVFVEADVPGYPVWLLLGMILCALELREAVRRR
jgi:hypothetical protein